MRFDDLNDELRERAKACTTPEEVLALTKAEGIELSDEDLKQISGGGWGGGGSSSSTICCPYCGSTNVYCVRTPPSSGPGSDAASDWECRDCGSPFIV